MLAARGLRAARSRRPAPSPRRAAAGAAASAAPPTPAGSGAAKLWGGRFSGGVDPLMEKFNESLSVDRRMAAEDCAGSRAYARALARAGLLSAEEASALVEGLAVVEAEWASNSFVTRPGDEDVHTANERRLGELVGPVAGKLHTGRSRNDQVATDTRLWLLTALRATRRTLRRLLTVAADRAEAEADALLPGYTHLQPAQPVRWSHWLLAHASAWRRDDERLGQARTGLEGARARPCPRLRTP